MFFKKRDDPSRAFDMPRHAQVQRLDALEDLERRHRRHAGAEVAQPFAPRPQQERARPRLLLEVHVVEALVRGAQRRSEEHTSELQSRLHLVCRLLLEKKKKKNRPQNTYYNRLLDTMSD